MTFALTLRQELAARAQQYARAHGLPFCSSYGESPSICFIPDGDGNRHGNFLPASYQAVLSNPDWRKRLGKVHTLGRRNLPPAERGRWMELDACTSSDALLMNVFCSPRLARARRLFLLLGATPGSRPSFGYRTRVPLANGRFDRTEVDLRLGDLLVEAKLTESDFQSAAKKVLDAYRDFAEVFDVPELPQTAGRFHGSQLLRNVLAAFALDCSFCLLIDTRRPDLSNAWYEVMKCVKPAHLRTRLRISTWQEVAECLPPKPQAFLAAKYGIHPTILAGCES